MALPKPQLRWLLFSLPLLFIALFYFYPLVKIVLLSFFSEGDFQPEKLSKLLSTPIYANILWFTIWQAALSTIITVVLALPGAYLFAKYRFFGKNLLQAIMVVPFVMPTVVTAAAFRAFLGKNGLLNNFLVSVFDLSQPPIQIEQTVIFFLLAHVFYNYTLVVRIVSSYWSTIDAKVIGAARMLGASPWTAFRTITLPLLMPAIGSAALLVFVFCFTSFGVILILGGPGFATVEVEIYRQAVQLFNLPMAATLSLVQICFNFFLMWLHAGITKKSQISFFSASAENYADLPQTLRQKFFTVANLIFMILLLVAPLLALLLRSISGENGFTLNYYTALFSSQTDSVFFVEPISAVKNSIGFAIAAMLISISLGLLASSFLSSGKSRMTSFWDAIIMLPLATSAVTLGFGYIITLNKPPINLRDSFALIPIAHALVALPFVVRCILPSMRQIPKSLKEAATLLGASPFIVWRSIELSLIRPALLVAAIFAFSISMGEFGASSFIARPHTPTMPVAIFRFLSQPGEMNYGQAMAMSTILMLVTCSSFWILGKFKNLRPSLTDRLK